ncbi:G-patch-domain-containing protein [Lentithecium fluviatile CBS 122367]|uniref:G-patch-domain-containing protein n=1 Tax=Lentithecium fluviatile CBS 122367 TaxID=1168545 RepID=A0A6G1IX74_9PLEO|nr:G-patch-domain-containing protein [Lentithecium fluviatile CBS 122367]
MADSDSEDDYMKMTFDDAPKDPQHETSLQRAARKRKEGEARSRQKSKAECEAEAELVREASLATALPETNKGFKMMAKFGFKQGDTLGKSETAQKEPIQIEIKEGRAGIGVESEKKRKYQEMWDQARREAKRAKEEEGNFFEERRQQQKERKAERDLDNAQRTAERLAEKEAEAENNGGAKEQHLTDINVLWRSRARHQIEHEHDRRLKNELTNSLASRLPTLAQEDNENDNDSKTALGHDVTPFYSTLENELEDEDPELAEFEALPVSERLQKILTFLRETYKYCLYCGHVYEGATMEGCPGVTEEDHD